MTPTNPPDPLRTTDHDPSAAAPPIEATTDHRSDSLPVGEDTASRRGSHTISVPGYEIESVLGRGGMGVVYKAQHLALKRTVALKMVLAGGHAGPQELARFRIEAEAVARLQHPNIVQIHEVGAADGHPYCALEFVAGGNLASKLDGKPLPAREAAKLVESLARAMQLAHSRNVVHRDLKPANILLASPGCESGELIPKITDFGLARRTDSDSGETQDGAVMGTPSYMAPEQASGRTHEAGPAADVYALGAILYDCLTGRPPFKGNTVVETLDQVRTQEPVPPSRWQKSVPLDLETICLKCLRKEPEKRYASAAELADELVRYEQGEPILARPVGRRERAVKWVKRNPVVAGAAAVVTLALAIATTVSYLKYRETEAALGERNTALGAAKEALGKADEAIKKEAERVEERDYQLGISDFLLAVAAYDNRDVVGAAERLDKVPRGQRGWEWVYLKQQIRGGLFTLYGHTSSVSSVSFSPDGARLVTASWDQTAQVWDASSGTPLLHLKGHTGWVGSVSFSPDGARLVTGSEDQTAKVWDARAGTLLLDLKGHTGGVSSVRFSPDEARLVTGSWDKTAKVWDARTGTLLLDLKGHTSGVSSVRFSPDGVGIVTGSWDGTAKVWDARTGTPSLDLKGHTHWVSSVRFSPDGARLVTGSWDQTAKVWDARSGTPLLDLKGHTSGIRSVSFSPDGTRLVTASNDQTAKVWDARGGTPLLDLEGHTNWVTSVRFAADGARLVTGSWDKTAKVWDARSGMPLLDLKGLTNYVWSVNFSPDGARLVTACQDRTAKVWDARTGTSLLDLKEHAHWVSSVSFSPDGARLVTGSVDKTAKVWDARTGTCQLDLKGHTGSVTSVSFSPDGTRLVTASDDRTVKVWDARTGTPLLDLKGHTDGVTSVSFSADGARLVTASNDQTAKVWDARAGQELKGDRKLDAEELEYRLIHTRPKYWRYQEGYDAARTTNDRFAVRFYLDRLLSMPMQRITERFKERNEFQADPLLIARTGFHHPALAKTPYDHGSVALLAGNGDRLAQRLVAQEFLRDGKPEQAIPLLFWCLASRPATNPPVEELLLAQAYLDLKQPAEAKRFYRAATEWLDRPRDPNDALGVGFAPNGDSRRNPFDWEVWHECDVFRAVVERRLAGKP